MAAGPTPLRSARRVRSRRASPSSPRRAAQKSSQLAMSAASFSAAVLPMRGAPRAKRNLAKGTGVVRRRSRASRNLAALVLAQPGSFFNAARSSSRRCGKPKLRRSAASRTSPASTSCSSFFLPTPAPRSMAPRAKKCDSRARAWAGHAKAAGQYRESSSSGSARTVAVPQLGHAAGSRQSANDPASPEEEGMICGMTSPARRTRTVSPGRWPRSVSRTVAALWRVADETVTSPTATGSRLATGVSAPRLPTETATSRSVVAPTAASPSNLWATAHRGALAVAPAADRAVCESSL
mmetsp:Transcript_13086/g.39562  ORF Transcript_13086/g.39562 Transcript_13086/m.39562 type:complete len:295 (-) Transcript_13086:783-1667(-)